MDKSILRKAIADGPEPTPGYLFRDITQMTFVDESTQQKLIAYLMDKLNPKNSVHILAKTLKVIKVLCETGHQDFQKEMQRQADFLKQFAQYRGVADAKFGDAYNERVRVASKEAIEAAFSARKETKLQIGSGLGNTAAEDAKKGPTFTTGNSIGGGGASSNPNMAPMPTTNKWAEEMAAKQKGTTGVSNIAQSMKTAVSTGFGIFKEGVKSDEERMREAMFHGSAGEFKAVELPTAGFGSAGGFGGGTGGASDWKFGEEATAAAAGPTTEVRLLTPIQKEVERICAFKNAPQRVDLSQFLQAVQTAVENGGSWDDVAEALDGRLAQSCPWQQRLNSLTCVEHVIRSSVSAEFNAYFVENPEDVHRNVFVVQASLKEKAQKVLKLLNIPERTAGHTGSAAPSAAALTSTTFGGNTQWAEATPAPAPSGFDGGLDLGGMTVKSRSTRGAAKAAEEDKTKLRKRTALVAPAEAPAVNDTWSSSGNQGFGASSGGGGFGTSTGAGGGFGDGGGWGNTSSGWGESTATGTTTAWGAAPATQPAVQQGKPQQGVDVDDFFSGLSTGGPATQQQQAPATWGSSAAAHPPQTTNAVTLDFLDTMLPSAPAPAAPAPVVQPAPPVFAPTAAPSAPSAGAPPANLAAMLAQQQQMAAMLSAQMQQVMVSNADPAVKQAQVQMLMQQQQQLMQMMQMLTQQSAAASAQRPAGAPAAGQQFAQLNEDMKRSMGF